MKHFFICFSVLMTANAFSAVYNLYTDRYVRNGKPVICTMTINSDNEKKEFISKGQGFDFVELVPKKANTQNYMSSDERPSEGWFGESCQLLEEQNVNCDALVLSGHFGGHFFGDSKKTLQLEHLEKVSCSNSCPRLLGKLKVAYLFGCNTLSDKTKDKRTPEQYLQVLLSDGFSRSVAEQVVEFRYGPTGDSFGDRLVRTLSGVQKVYGFTSVSPAGTVIAPYLRKYLSTHPDIFKTVNPDPLVEILKSKNLDMRSGIMNNARDVKIKNNTCYLAKDDLYLEQKLAKAEGLLKEQDNLIYLPQIIKLVNETPTFSRTESTILGRIGANAILKDKVLKILSTKLPPTMKIEWYKFARIVKWIDNPVYWDGVKISLVGLLAPPYSTESKEEFQFYLKKFPGFLSIITDKDIPANYYSQYGFYRQFTGLDGVNKSLQLKFCQVFANTTETRARLEVAALLEHYPINDSACLQSITKLVGADALEYRRTAKTLILNSRTKDQTIQQKLSLMLNHHNGDVRWDVYETLVKLRPTDPVIINRLKAGLRDSNQDVRELVEVFLRTK